jgi:hypothetical protein
MTKQGVVYCKEFEIRLKVLSLVSPKQPFVVGSQVELFRVMRKNSISWVLLIFPLELELNQTIAKIKTETTTEPKIFVLSSTDLILIDQEIPFLLGADWKEYFLEWFTSALEGEIPKIRITTGFGLSSRLNSVIKRLRLLRRFR